MAGANIGGHLYTIPVDSLDLTFLSKYIRKPVAETRPLWTRNRLDGESEYCYVQIVTQDEDKDCYSEPSDTYKCHICNVHVPNMCHETHNDSAEHETMKNISQRVLERVSNQMNISEISNDKDIDKDVYYCGSCSKIIKKENKHRHELSAYHVKSKKKITIASKFYKIFKEHDSSDAENDDNEDTDEESDVEPDNFKSYIANNNIDTTNNNLPIILDSDIDSVAQKPVTDNQTIIPTVSHTENKIQPKIEKKTVAINTETFEEQLKEMIRKFKLHVIPPVMKDEFILIVAPNGDTVKVSQEHFHSYRPDRDSVYCQLCKIWISQDTKPHNETETHVRNILKPINEKFARMIDTVSSHCVLCNEVVLTNSNHHSINDGHKKILNDTRIPKPGKTLCEDCNIYIDTHNYDIHMISRKHLLGLGFIRKNVRNASSDFMYLCEICNLMIPRYNIRCHVISKTHQAKQTNAATVINDKNNGSTNLNNKNNDSTQTINDISNDSTAVGIKINDSDYCEAYKVKVPTGGLQTHIDGKVHKKVISELCSVTKNDFELKEHKIQSGTAPDSVTENGGSVSTTTNKVNFASINFKTSFDTTTNISDSKINAYYKLLEYVDDTKIKVRCKICNVEMFYVDRTIIEHMERNGHVENYNKIPTVANNKLFYTDDANNRIKCKICDVIIPERDVIEHSEGVNHIVGELELLKFHSITKESAGYRCDACDKYITEYSDHIDSKAHTQNFLDTHVIDRNDMRKYVYDYKANDYAARRHRKRYRNLLKYNEITKIDRVTYYCRICDVILPRICEIDHVLGNRHAWKLVEMK